MSWAPAEGSRADPGAAAPQRAGALPACAMGSLAVRRLIALLPGSGMHRRGEGSFAAISTFSIPLETRQEFALFPLPSPPAHRMGTDPEGGARLGKCPCSQGGEGRCAGAEDGVHGCTHVAHPVPAAPSPRHREAHGMPVPVPSSSQYQHPAQPGGTQSRGEGHVAHPSPVVGAGGQQWDPAFAPQGRGQRSRLELPGRFGHPLLLQINGCAVKKIEAIILSSHPLYPPTSTT